MEILITNTIKTDKASSSAVSEIKNEFVNLLNWLQEIDSTDERSTEDQLRSKKPLLIYFEIGFGGHHMWVKQVGYMQEENVITVKF